MRYSSCSRGGLVLATGLLAFHACQGHQEMLAGLDRPEPAPAGSAYQILPCATERGEADVLRVRGGTARDHALACAALVRALGFFDAQGLAPHRHVMVEFRPAVMWGRFDSSVGYGEAVPVPGSRGLTDPRATAQALDRAEQVAGVFDRGRGVVVMTSEGSPWLRGTSYFGQRMSDELITTILTHEISHALSRSLYAHVLRSPDVDLRVQEEYVGYVAQLTTMEPGLRAAILAHYPAPRTRSGSGNEDGAINALTLALGPEAFGVMSFRHFTGPAGGRAFLDRLYSGKFRPRAMY